MAYEEEIDFQPIEQAIQDDLVSNALDVTSTPLTEDTEATVQVTAVEQGIPRMRRMKISKLTENADKAARDAKGKADEAQTAARKATDAATEAMSAAESARSAVTATQTAIEDLRQMISAYYQQADQNVKLRLVELAQMADEGRLEVAVSADTTQLFEDFVAVTGYTGSYNDFLILLGQGGGASIIIDTSLSSTSTNPVQNKAIKTAMDGKQDVINYLTNQELNEMFNDDGTMRENIWYKTIGPDYIEHALIKAHEVDPDAKLYLNEYTNEEMGHPKADAMYNFVKDLKDRGVPINGVGMQLHLDTTIPCSEDAIRANLERYNELGLEISFSEVDIRIPTGEKKEENLPKQQEMYVMLYKLAKEMPNVKSVITWGISDKHSWVPATFAGKGDALLYDTKLQPKPVYTAVLNEISK